MLKIKEALPLFKDGGKTKERMAFFECPIHEGTYFKMTYRQERQIRSEDCPCDYAGGFYYRRYTTEQVRSYSYQKHRQQLIRAHKTQHPSWFKVRKHDLLVEGHIFYEFESKKDRKAAKEVENAIWNSINPISKSTFLTRFSFKLDEMHSNGEITFDCPFWNRGAGRDFFKDYLT